jgi:thymidylate synthase
MKQYLNALQYILDNGEDVNDRTGVGTRTVFGHQMRFSLQDSFPAVTTKRLMWKSVVSELLWFLEGSTDEHKFLGPVYGSQWRNFNSFDQIETIIDQLKNDPDSRRIILSAWNVSEIPDMALPPCHTMSQFKVINGKLSCQLYQRSADMFLGVPFNIASYSLLTHMLAQICNLEVGDFVWTGGDCHIYSNHMDQVKEQLARKPVKGPTLLMPKFATLGELLATKTSAYTLLDYDPMLSIKAPMAV